MFRFKKESDSALSVDLLNGYKMISFWKWNHELNEYETKYGIVEIDTNIADFDLDDLSVSIKGDRKSIFYDVTKYIDECFHNGLLAKYITRMKLYSQILCNGLEDKVGGNVGSH